jgi:hypothetical protein
MTHAEIVADRLNNDGQCWTAADGITFDELIAAQEHTVEFRDGQRQGDSYRFVFRDGGVITVNGDAWDLGFTDCFCWAGNPADDCAGTHNG